jgi:CubicO group peptidase (beta-lactamase class C family)
MSRLPMHRAAAALAAATLALSAADLAAQETASKLPAGVTRAIDGVFARFDRADSPGCALGVYQDGGIAYARGYGSANLEHGVPIGPRTIFDIGSTSKQMTAMSIALLAKDGTLSLDDDVRRWIPELPRYPKTITIRHLLNHTSGLRDYLTLMSLRGTNFDGVTTGDDALALIVRQRATNFEPGSEYLYSNSGFYLLGEIVERASGKSLPRFAEERIFRPLGMRVSHFHDDHTMLVPGRATGYAPRPGGGFRIDMSGFEQVGDGAVLTNIEELQRWDRNFYDATVGGPEVLRWLQTPSTLRDGSPLTYALGLVVDRYRGLPTVRHGGSWAGYRAELLRFPEERTSVAVLCNLANSAPSRLANEVADVLLAARLAPRDSASAPARARAAAAVNARVLATYAGWYRDPASEDVRFVEVRGDTLFVGTGGDEREALLALEEGRFEAPRWRSELRFDRAVSGGSPRLIEQERGGRPVTFERYEPARYAAARLGDFAGEYVSDELDIRYTIAVDSGRLEVRLGGVPERPLVPTVADTFRDPDGVVVRFRRDAARRVTGFSVDAGRVRGIEFARVERAGAAEAR